jgi:hypothetical protein
VGSQEPFIRDKISKSERLFFLFLLPYSMGKVGMGFLLLHWGAASAYPKPNFQNPKNLKICSQFFNAILTENTNYLAIIRHYFAINSL